MPVRRALALIALFAVASGCGSPDPPPPKPSGVSYLRTGGVAGVAEGLVIRADGGARLVARGRAPRDFEVAPATLDKLRRQLDDANFEELARNDRTIPEPDGFNYTMAYRGHLIVREGSGLEPALRPAVNTLQTIVDDRR
jgi:hypothetical protein